MIALAVLVISLSMFMGTFVQAQRSAVIINNRLDAVNQSSRICERVSSTIAKSIYWRIQQEQP